MALFTPRTIAVKPPGFNVACSADSFGDDGAKPSFWIVDASGPWPQSSFDEIRVPCPSCSSRIGSARAPLTPSLASEGPSARITTFLGAEPVAMKPPIRTLGSGWTSARVLGSFVASGSGGLVSPRPLVFGPDGNLYVGDYGGASVLRYNGTTGTFIDQFVTPGSGNLAGPTFLVFNNGTSVPDGSFTLTLLGMSLGALAGFAKMRKAAA